METIYLDAVSSCLPNSDIFNANESSIIANTNQEFRRAFDNILRFAIGDSPPDSLTELQERQAWQESQVRLSQLLSNKSGNNDNLLGKRRRENNTNVENDSNESKRKKQAVENTQRTDADTSDPLFTLHSISITSPLRRKVDIAMTASSIRLSNPSTNAVEISVSLSSITRAFLLPSIGKNNNKPRWNVVLLTADTYDRKSKTGENQPVQLIFSIDATTSGGKDALRTSEHNGPGSAMTTLSKGSDTLPCLQKILSFLPSHVMYSEPQEELRVDAYRAAKEGTLYFMKEGILWHESRPCEFFALQDLMADDGGYAGGVKTLSVTGRTFSIFVRRKAPESEHTKDEDSEEQELEGEETEFSMIDGKEQERVTTWIRKHKHLFGKPRNGNHAQGKPTSVRNGAPNSAANVQSPTKGEVEEDSDDEDDADFVDDGNSDGGSISSSEDEENGSVNHEDEAEAEESVDEEQLEEEEEMTNERHPLLLPGAMPRMSKAAMEAVIGMVEHDLMGDASTEGEDELDE